ncbi:MAG: thiamine pyrophosphate-dependent enzyme [Candidatus Anstonellales archaeon]
MITVKDFTPKENPQWCPGCGNFAIINSIKAALAKMQVDPEDVVVVSGVGCSGKSSHYINTYGFEGLHGRTLPLAAGVKLTNHDLIVIAEGGDGDGYGIGMGHFVHSLRRNLDLTYIVHDNQIYGLTTGQTSPTTLKGMKTRTNPEGAVEEPIHPVELALSCGGSFVARAYAGDLPHMVNIIVEAIRHKGFSFVDVLQPCITFNKMNTYAWFQERVYKLEEAGHNPKDWNAAMEKAREEIETNYKKLPIGIFYKEERPTYWEEAGYPKPLLKLEQKTSVEEDLKALM